jgi:hypothetical protein
VFQRVRDAIDTLKATARALDPLGVDGRDAAALFEIESEGRACVRSDEGADSAAR